ncbi:MAG: hypothetical protein ACFFCW_24120 [Candidatus Hodarchaeota archaeon]
MTKKGDYHRYSLLGGELNQPIKQCRSKLTCERVKKRYTGEILPVCPLVKEVINKDTFPNIHNLPQTSSKNDAIIRILEVFCELIARQQPTREFIKWCAHRDNVLQDCMNLVDKDLTLLPKRYEKDYPQTSQKLEKLIKRLYANVLMYQSAHNSRVFMLPLGTDKFLRDYRNVLAWQEEKENPDEALSTYLLCDHVSGMVKLTYHYPAVAIQTMNKISNELLSVAQIDIEKPKEKEAKLHSSVLFESEEIILLAKEIIDEATRWLERPEAVYPFNDMRIMSDTIFYGTNTDPQTTTEALNRIDHLIESLSAEGKNGLARQIEQKVDSVKEKLAGVDRLVALGYRREQCLTSLKQSVRALITTLTHLVTIKQSEIVNKQITETKPQEKEG